MDEQKVKVKSKLLTYYEQAQKTNTLASVTIELTNKCNWRCKHCYIPSYTNHGFSLSFLESLFKDLRNMGVLNLVFTGGEMFLRDDVLDIVKIAREMFFRVTILSNASLLDEKTVAKLSKLHISEYSLTIFSTNEELHDKISCVKGSFEKAMNGVRLLKKYNIPVEIKTPLIDDNKFEFGKISEFCKKEGVKFLSNPSIMCKSDGDISPSELRVSDADLEEVFLGLREIFPENEFKRIYNKNASPCSILKHTLSIDCYGNVHPCNSYFYKVGNIKAA